MREAQPGQKANMGSMLLVERPDDTTAIVTLNRPERRNALSIELMQSFCRNLQSLAAEPRRRVLILQGNGPAFCAGLDLQETVRADHGSGSAQWIARTFELLSTSRLITFAAAHGAAYAGGLGLLACCDFVVAADDLRICLPEVRRGLVPALVTALLRSRLRDRDLRELLLLAEPIDARKAFDIGLIHRVVPRERLSAEIDSMVALVLQGAPEAVRETKRLLSELGPIESGQQWSLALDFHTRARHSDEAREGVAAFQEHRRPKWSGLEQAGEAR